MVDYPSFQLALILLERVKRHPESYYRALKLHERALQPDVPESDELDVLEYLGWTPAVYAQKETVDAIRKLEHIIVTFMTSFSKNAKAPDPPDPSYRPGQHHDQKSRATSAPQGSNSPAGPTKKTNAYAGKVITLADMDAEFFANHKTEYGVK